LLELQALGEQGAMSAQYKLALFLEDERREYREAECWFRRAAQQGHNQAKRRLALLLRFGKGATEDIIHNQTVPRNSTEAVKLFREAAARFDPEALFVLGQMVFLLRLFSTNFSTNPLIAVVDKSVRA
jgi:TPR repeat protein